MYKFYKLKITISKNILFQFSYYCYSVFFLTLQKMKKPISVILFSVFVIIMGLFAAGLNVYLLAVIGPSPRAWTSYAVIVWGGFCALAGFGMLISKQNTSQLAFGCLAVLLIGMIVGSKIFDIMGIGSPLMQTLVAGALSSFSKPFACFLGLKEDKQNPA